MAKPAKVETPMISVIVPTYNEQGFVEGCLKALLSQRFPRKEFEIIVSDSSSTDKTAQIAKKYADLVVVCRKQGAGFGRNFGAKHAKGEILAFIDADTIACPEWLQGIKEAFSDKKCVAAAGHFCAPKESSLLEKAYFFLWNIGCRFTILIGRPLIPGLCIAVKKSAFDSGACFDNEPLVCEDYELCRRLRKIGKIKFNKKIFVSTSARRLAESGVFKYTVEGIVFVLFKKRLGWKQHRRDW